MPLYEYQCEACGGRFEVIQKFSDAPVETCRACGGSPVRRLVSSPAIQFKGSGWYITDYSQKGKAPAESTGATSGKPEGAGTGADAAGTAPKDASSAGASDKPAAPAGGGTAKPTTPA